MNTYDINDKSFINTKLYDDFMGANPGLGSLEIRAYAASEAVPISGVKVEVFTNFKDNKIIFFNGYTDVSGKTPKMYLPAPKMIDDNMDVPNKTVYEINSVYIPDNVNKNYKVNLYDGICVMQDIVVVPDMIRIGEDYGS